MTWLRLDDATALIDHDVQKARERLGARNQQGLAECDLADFPRCSTIPMCRCAFK